MRVLVRPVGGEGVVWVEAEPATCAGCGNVLKVEPWVLEHGPVHPNERCARAAKRAAASA